MSFNTKSKSKKPRKAVGRNRSAKGKKKASSNSQRERKQRARFMSKMYRILDNEKNWIPLEEIDEMMYKDAKPALRRLKAGKTKLHRLEDI